MITVEISIAEMQVDGLATDHSDSKPQNFDDHYQTPQMRYDIEHRLEGVPWKQSWRLGKLQNGTREI
ncbi:hypothetical protein GCM10025859_46250 [Alicyclobacillus fastidiosus]|nr:hypothetical protein GCM10025859_46250 [Alicyclobacillus fastidiosus]